MVAEPQTPPAEGRSVTVEIAPGELIDKITILDEKSYKAY